MKKLFEMINVFYLMGSFSSAVNIILFSMKTTLKFDKDSLNFLWRMYKINFDLKCLEMNFF